MRSPSPASSSGASAAWPSLRWTTAGSIPRARSARTPPTPSRMYCESRVRSSATYRRVVIQRSSGPFSGTLGVEQEQRHATDVDAPDLGDDIGVVDRHRDRQRLAGLVGHQRRRQPLRIGVDPVLVLPTACVDPLTEVALAVHQADGDHRQPAIGRLLEQVAGERTEAAGVHRQRQVHAVLGAQERDRPVDRKPRVGGALQIGVDGRLEHGRALDERRVGRGAAQRLDRGLLQQANRVLRGTA